MLHIKPEEWNTDEDYAEFNIKEIPEIIIPDIDPGTYNATYYDISKDRIK